MRHRSGNHGSRRSSLSMPWPPEATGGRSDSHFSSDSNSIVARKGAPNPQSQSVTDGNGSHDSEAAGWTDPLSDASREEKSIPNPDSVNYLQPNATDQDIRTKIHTVIVRLMDSSAARCFDHADMSPPITPDTLSELDMLRIISNPKLRHDVNFDPNLTFRPNLDGEKGVAKTRRAQEYWRALESEFTMYAFASECRKQGPKDEKHWSRVLKASQRRLPKLFEAVRDILNTLVPTYQQRSVAERLDVDLIMQQISNGVCDLVGLANWLAQVLKAHCAPMRDELVNAMRKQIEIGAQKGQLNKLVSGLRQLLHVLEHMKLDVANHQLRHMRTVLIRDTVKFQRTFNAHRLAAGKVDAKKARSWLQDEMDDFRGLGSEPAHLEALASALLTEMLFHDKPQFPQTFYLDEGRLAELRSNIRSTVYHELCCEILAELTPSSVPKVHLIHAQAHLSQCVNAIVGSSGRVDRFAAHIENIAVEIVRILLTLDDRYPPFNASMLPVVEQKLTKAFKSDSPAFDRVARGTHDRLLPKVTTSVEKHVNMSALELQDALVPKVPSQTPGPPAGFGAVCRPPQPQQKPRDPEEYFVQNLTHLICLHWHVWTGLVYLPRPDLASESPIESARSSSSSTSASPIISAPQVVCPPPETWHSTGVSVPELPNGRQTASAKPKPNQEQRHDRTTPSAKENDSSTE